MVYILQNNQKSGPIDDVQLRDRLASGEILPHSLVWREGEPDWIALEEYLLSRPGALAPAPYHSRSVAMPSPTAAVAGPQVVIIRESPNIPTSINANLGGERGSGMAMAAFVCGLLSFIAVFPAIPAIICGHMARAQTKRDPTLTGRGLATAGLVIGYLVLIGAIASSLFFIFLMLVVGVAANAGH